MPRGKKKSSKPGGLSLRVRFGPGQITGNEEGISSDCETSSMLSFASDSTKDGSVGPSVGELEGERPTFHQDDLETRIAEAIDGASQKSSQGRVRCFEIVRRALSSGYMNDFIMERKSTLSDMLERGLRKGKDEERGCSALLAALLAIQFGAGEDSENLFNDLQTYMVSLLIDSTSSPSVRSKCATSLGLMCFISEPGNNVAIKRVMDSLLYVFRDSFLHTNGTVPSHTSDIAALHNSALLAWGLLLTISTTERLFDLAESHIQYIAEILESSHLDLRISAGEVIAILHEMVKDHEEIFSNDKFEDLCDRLKELATDGQKFRAKKDRRQQRTSFRDIYRSVKERNNFPGTTIKFGREVLDIDSWSKKRQYDAFCQVLGSGMNNHLMMNELLRDVFDLGLLLNGPPLLQKPSKFERNRNNVASCKDRTKTRRRLREKKLLELME